MHVVISWDISASGDRWQKIDQYLLGAFGAFSYVRPLSTFFVVKISSAEDRTRILADLQTRAKALPEKIELLVSPIMPTGARFGGMLVPNGWTEVNNLTG